MQEPECIRPAQSMQAQLLRTVLFILKDQQRIVEEYLLGFRLRDIMLASVFAGVAMIPVKAFDPVKINHKCILL